MNFKKNPFLHILLFSFFSCCLMNCGKSNQNTDQSKQTNKSIDENANNTEKSAQKPSPKTEIDMLDLEKKGFFKKDCVLINVAYDPVFFRKKSYKGISLKHILEENLDLKGVDTTNTRLIFECEDKYVVTMRLGQALHHKGFVALKDTETPQGKRYMPAYKGDDLKELDPFYIVWENTPKGDMSFVWPYNLTKIKMK